MRHRGSLVCDGVVHGICSSGRRCNTQAGAVFVIVQMHHAMILVHHHGRVELFRTKAPAPGALGKMWLLKPAQPVGSVEKSETRRPPEVQNIVVESLWWSKEVLDSETLDCCPLIQMS
jgi:hypothetical protein